MGDDSLLLPEVVGGHNVDSSASAVEVMSPLPSTSHDVPRNSSMVAPLLSAPTDVSNPTVAAGDRHRLIELRKGEIERDELLINNTEKIGSGAFGQVFKGKYKGFDVAVKEFKLDKAGAKALA